MLDVGAIILHLQPVTNWLLGSSFLVSMMLAPSVPQVLSEFRPRGGSKFLGSFSVTVYILGFCVAPLLLGPLTDLHGRIVIYRVSSVCFLLLTVGCALSPSLEALIAFRFFVGCFGGAPMAIGGAVIADMYEPGKRDGPMAMYSVGTMMGPTIGPVLGGVITGLHGWRWVFWVASILVRSSPHLSCFARRSSLHLLTLDRPEWPPWDSFSFFQRHICQPWSVFRSSGPCLFPKGSLPWI